MANLDQPCGAVPHERCIRSRKYVAAAAIYPGDFVSLDSGGKVAVASASAALVGVALSYASAADEEVLVADAPDQLFKVQADDTTVDAQTDINLNYNILATSPSTAYKISRHELDASTQATTSTLPLRLLAIDARPDNALGGFVDCIVKINNHQLGSGTGTEGI